MKENIKAPRHWPLCGGFTGDRRIPRTKGQKRGKWFYLIYVIMKAWYRKDSNPLPAPMMTQVFDKYMCHQISNGNHAMV